LNIPTARLVLSRWLLRRQQLDLQRCHYGACDLILNLENVIQVAIVGFGPEVVAVVGANELCGDAQSAAGLAHAAFQDMRNAKRPGDIGYGRLPPLEVE